VKIGPEMLAGAAISDWRLLKRLDLQVELALSG